MKKNNIPVNVLDKLKFELNKYNKQYFFAYYCFNGDINVDLFRQSVEKIYELNPKLNYILGRENNEYEYSQSSFKDYFHCINDLSNISITHLIEDKIDDCIKISNFAPLVLLLAKEGDKNVLVLAHNHIYYDGSSAYAIFNQIISFYNGCEIKSLKTISDNEALKIKFKQNTILNRSIKFITLIKNAISSLIYLSSYNKISKIYNEKEIDERVCYKSFSCDLLNKRDKYSNNTEICAAIAKAYLSIKGNRVNNTVSISVPSNFRNRDQMHILGNLVYSISIKLHNTSIEKMRRLINKKIKSFKKIYMQWASYKLFYTLSKIKSSDGLVDAFRKQSNKHHFYISNFGNFDLNYNKFFKNCYLDTAGGFNFPLQKNFGLIFTIVPYKESFSIGIAYAESYFTDEKIKEFKSQFLKEYNK